MNRRPSGYEPDELPDCSIPRLCGGILQSNDKVSTFNAQDRQNNHFRCVGSPKWCSDKAFITTAPITGGHHQSVMFQLYERMSRLGGRRIKNNGAQKRPLFRVAFFDVWLREPDLNRRPSGYEPDELPDCSIPRLCVGILQRNAVLSSCWRKKILFLQVVSAGRGAR